MKNWSGLPAWFWVLAALILPAFLINLGLMTISEDEAIRALVALEMDITGNLITPTLNGSFYYAKPPLYNWILLFIYQWAPSINEWTLRLPTVIFLVVFAFQIYRFSLLYFDRHYALLNAFLFLSCGRILFWDSMLGYIDTLYSLVVFIQLTLVYRFTEKQEWKKLFLWTYFLVAIGFMLKGFPSLVFQAITLIVWLWYKGNLRALWGKMHFFGIALFTVIVGSYYVVYFQYNDLSQLFDTLLDQSTRRTIVHENIAFSDLISHLLSYPFENFYHFFPWSILILFTLRKDFFHWLKANEFMMFCTLIFLSNILVYWVSPEVYPRYILMLAPFAFAVFLGSYKRKGGHMNLVNQIVFWLFLAVIVSALAISFYLPFMERLNGVQAIYIKAWVPAFFLGILVFQYLRKRNLSLVILIASLFTIRILFNFFVLPERHAEDFATACKTMALDIGERYKEKDLRIYKDTKIDWTSSFYISKTRDKITAHDYQVNDPEAFYVLDTIKYEIPEDFTTLESFTVREHRRTLFIVQPEK